jgi:hypothetical protein
MLNNKIILSVIIVLVIGVVAAGYQMSSSTTGLYTPIQSQSQDNSPLTSGTGSGSDQGSSSGSSSSSGQSSGTGSVDVKVTSSEAKIIAQRYIEEPGASAGEPVLKDLNGKQTYVVPVMMNGDQVGEIYIDPQTGENLGGAGGVSYG